MKSLLFALSVVCAYGLQAGTVYVDCNFDDYTGHDGSTPELAYETIQEAVEAAEGGSDISIAPGVYRKGVATTTAWGLSRIYLTGKKLRFFASDPSAETVIEGLRSETGSFGGGGDAVRCVTIKDAEAAKSVFENLTFRNGATVRDYTGATAIGSGAAVCSATDGGYTAQKGPYLIGCTVTNCGASKRGGIAFGCTMLRCRIVRNVFEASTVFSLFTTFVNSLIAHNVTEPTSGTSYGSVNFDVCDAINCTFADNWTTLYLTTVCYLRNNLVCLTAITKGGGVLECNFDDTDATRVLMGPAIGDVRLRAGVTGVDVADAKYLGSDYLSLPEGIDPYVDLYGMRIAKEGPIAAGASQGTATPVAGALIINSARLSLAKGFPGRAGTYVHPASYPVNYRIHMTDIAVRRIVEYQVAWTDATGAEVLKETKFPLADDSIDVIPPPTVGEALTVNIQRNTSSIMWADPNADPETEDGSFEHPFTTLQKATDAATTDQYQGGVVLAKAGVYTNGVKTFSFNGSTGKTRLSITGDRRIIAVDGPERTFICGEPDPATGGCGKDAVVAVANGGLSQVQGFTITGSYASTDAASAGYYNTGRGGAAYEYGSNCRFCDCIISNNVGMYYGVGMGRFSRCRITGNEAPTGVLGSGNILISCVIANNSVTGSGKALIDGAAKIYFCSIVGDPDDTAYANNADGVRINTAIDDGGLKTQSSGLNAGCVYHGFASYAGSGYLVADPYFADKATADLRMAYCSKGVTAGIGPSAENAANWWYYATTGVDGGAIGFDASGRPLPGAYTTVAKGVYVDAPDGGIAVTGGRIGLNGLQEGESLSIAAAEGPRPIFGLCVNGVTNGFDALGGSLTISAADLAAAGGSVLVETVCQDKWYVDANGGNDANLGFTPGTAKRTLEGALTNRYLTAGDRVVALPGIYAEGSMIENPALQVRSRAVVPAGVTLESRDGRAVTKIVGKEADELDDPYEYAKDDNRHGLGLGAIRCVYLNDRSRVKGFTIENGHTRRFTAAGVMESNHPDTCGGGVFCSYHNSPAFGSPANVGYVEDCFVTNCASSRGGGAFGVRAINTVFCGNCATYVGGGMNDGEMYGCLVFGNDVEYRFIRQYSGAHTLYAVDRCTAEDCVGLAGGYACNSVLYQSAFGNLNSGAAVTNCLIVESGVYTWPKDGQKLAGSCDCVLTNADALACDEKYRPTIGANLAVDRGVVGLLAHLTDTDVWGGQRVYNGTMDVGAIEADWRPVYARDIRKSQFAVGIASPAVIDHGDGIVTLNGASTLSAVWANPRQKAGEKCVTMKVTGNGTLYVRLNGETVKEVTAATADPAYTFDNALASNTLDFEYVPGENDAGHAEILDAKSLGGLLLLLK